MLAPVLDQSARDQIRLLRIFRWPRPGSRLLDLLFDLGREALPHQRFGEIRRRRDQHHARETGRRRVPALARRLSSRASRSAIHPPIDEPITICGPRQNCLNTATLSSSQRPIVPSAKVAAGFPVPGIVEAHAGAALLRRPRVERLRLGAFHVGLESAEPEQAGAVARRGCAPRYRALAAPSPIFRDFRLTSFIRLIRRCDAFCQRDAGPYPFRCKSG